MKGRREVIDTKRVMIASGVVVLVALTGMGVAHVGPLQRLYVWRLTVEANASRGLYRLPFADGTRVKVFDDFLTHRPKGREDLFALEGRRSRHPHPERSQGGVLEIAIAGKMRGALGLAPTNRFQKLGNVRAEGRQVISESFNMVALRKFRPW